MSTYKVIMKHQKTDTTMFLKVEDCRDMDQCIQYVLSENPDFFIQRITPCSPRITTNALLDYGT